MDNPDLLTAVQIVCILIIFVPHRVRIIGPRVDDSELLVLEAFDYVSSFPAAVVSSISFGNLFVGGL